MSIGCKRRTAAMWVTAVCVLSAASPLDAQNAFETPLASAPQVLLVPNPSGLSDLPEPPDPADRIDLSDLPNLPDLRGLPRPSALPPLYVSFAALQGLDVHSTLRALDRGGREANPLVGSVLNSRGGLLALKAAGTVGTIYFTEKLWKRNRMAAVITMIGMNSAYAIVVSHNYAVR